MRPDITNRTIQYNRIGSFFINDDKRLPAVMLTVVAQKYNQPSCDGCFFKSEKVRSCNKHACTPYFRKDRKHVIFKAYDNA